MYFWKIIRANVILTTTQTSDYSPYLLSGCKLLDLGHGHPIKDIGSISSNKKSKYIFTLSKKFIKFYMIVTSDFAKNRASLDFNIPEKNIYISNFARNDVFNDLSLRVMKNELINSLKKGRKAIVYMPTHRSDGIVKMNIHEILDLQQIQKICSDNDYVFIIKKHFYHRFEKEDLSKYLNIFDVTSIDNIDTQVLLSQTDILITDYSACYIDFLLLNRPIILYQYDIEEFQKNERSFFIPFTQLNIGEKPKTKLELNNTINEYISGYIDKYIAERAKLSMFYFNSLEPNKGRDNVFKILNKLI
jgi:CDP-glycerol glycerophosphotransferase (TagB/SpsB family)